jgi:hypothetical protein
LKQKRDNYGGLQRLCILVCNSPRYSLPVFETPAYTGKTSEQLATILQEVISRLQRPKINCFVFRRVLICR